MLQEGIYDSIIMMESLRKTTTKYTNEQEKLLEKRRKIRKCERDWVWISKMSSEKLHWN